MRSLHPSERLEWLLGDPEEPLRLHRARPHARGGRTSALVLDVGSALLLTAFLCAVTLLALSNEGPEAPDLDAGAYALCVLAGLVFALRRRFPLLVYAVTVSCTAAFSIVYHGGPIFVSALLAMLWLVASRPRRLWVPLVLAGVPVFTVAHVLGEGLTFGILVIAAVWVGTAALFGEVVRSRRAAVAEVRARARVVELQREEETLRRVAEERLRIAREVHDVVGHGLAAISLQAGVAEHLLDSRPEEARSSLASIRRVSRTALDELRAEIGALRGDGGAPLRRPTPGLDALPRLVDAMHGAGLDVDLDVRREDVLAPPEVVQTAGYRIVQEALTNVARHAGPGAHVDVRVACEGAHLVVEVVDDGPGASHGVPEGNGLAGMRERAESLGGSFEAGAASGGGFRVRASLPAGAA